MIRNCVLKFFRSWHSPNWCQLYFFLHLKINFDHFQLTFYPEEKYYFLRIIFGLVMKFYKAEEHIPAAGSRCLRGAKETLSNRSCYSKHEFTDLDCETWSDISSNARTKSSTICTLSSCNACKGSVSVSHCSIKTRGGKVPFCLLVRNSPKQAPTCSRKTWLGAWVGMRKTFLLLLLTWTYCAEFWLDHQRRLS